MTESTESILKQIEEGRRILQATGNTDHYPIRYVVTHIADDIRVLTFANTFSTKDEAQHLINQIRQNNSASILAMYGVPDTLEVRAVKCYPGHHDPMRTVFDS